MKNVLRDDAGCQGLLEVLVLRQGDLDRLGYDVGLIGPVAEVLRVLIDGSDERGSRRLTVSNSAAALG